MKNNQAIMITFSSIQLNRDEDVSLYMQIYSRIKLAILQGNLLQGTRLPSTRALATELNLSRSTVEVAYEMLSGEGLLHCKGPAGSFVTSTAIIQNKRVADSNISADFVKSERDGFQSSAEMMLHPCIPSLDLFPKKLWAKLTHKRMSDVAKKDLVNGNHAGYWPLRVAICNYLQLSRGVFCSPEQIFITRGFQGALDLLTRTILELGDNVIMEDPCYRQARNLLTQAKMNLIFAPVDQEGIQVDWIKQNATNFKLISVTPSHQSPTGVMLSISRRVELLELAKLQNTWILEDDYDGEYRYVGKPLPSLKSLDIEDRVIYAGTFSKVLFPALRTGYVVVPKKLISTFESATQTFQTGCPVITQMVISDFMNHGHFSRHIRKMRGHYVKRRQWLINALVAIFHEDIKIELQKSGMHLIASFNLDKNDFELAEIAKKAGFGIQALSEWSVHTRRKGLLIGFTNIESLESACELASNLKNLFLHSNYKKS